MPKRQVTLTKVAGKKDQKFIGFHVDPQTHKLLLERCRDLGCSRSWFIRELVRQELVEGESSYITI